MVEALRPAWANWIPIFTLSECAKSIIGLKLIACASSSIDVQPIVMRPCGVTPVASTMIMPGAPVASAPRCALCQGPTCPSVAMYWHIGETHTRLVNSVSRSFSGEKSALMWRSYLCIAWEEKKDLQCDLQVFFFSSLLTQKILNLNADESVLSSLGFLSTKVLVVENRYLTST